MDIIFNVFILFYWLCIPWCIYQIALMSFSIITNCFREFLDTHSTAVLLSSLKGTILRCSFFNILANTIANLNFCQCDKEETIFHFYLCFFHYEWCWPCLHIRKYLHLFYEMPANVLYSFFSLICKGYLYKYSKPLWHMFFPQLKKLLWCL